MNNTKYENLCAMTGASHALGMGSCTKAIWRRRWAASHIFQKSVLFIYVTGAVLYAPPTPAASSSHGPTILLLATDPSQSLVSTGGHISAILEHVWRLICLPCHVRIYNYCNWLTVVSGRCSKSLLRPLKIMIDWLAGWLADRLVPMHGLLAIS